MIMTARQDSSPRISSSSWVAEYKAEEGGRNPAAADPSVFEDADEDVEFSFPNSSSGESASRPAPIKATIPSPQSSTSSSQHPSLSLLTRSLESLVPSDFLFSNSKSSSSSIEMLKKMGYLEGSVTSPAAQAILQASIGLSSLSGTQASSILQTSRPSSPIPTTATAAAAAAKKPAAATTAKATPASPGASSSSSPRAAVAASFAAAAAEKSVPTLTAVKTVVEVGDIRENDVLSGRGGKTNHHSGNKRYRQVVAEMKHKYRGTSAKTDKTALSRAIVDYVNGYGGRFLRKDAKLGKYVVMSKDEARKKTSQALRETKELKWMLHNS